MIFIAYYQNLIYTYKRGYVVGGCKMDKTYVLLLFAAKLSDLYVAMSKTKLEKAREYLKDKYLANLGGKTR